MKIGTKERLVTIMSLAVIGLIAALIWWTYEEVDVANRQRQQASEIARGLSQLRLLAFEYRLYHDERAKLRWYVLSDQVNGLIANTETSIPTQDQILASMRERRARVVRLFAEFTAAAGSRADAPLDESTRVVEGTLLSRLLAEQQDNFANVFRLTDIATERINDAQRSLLFVSLAGLGLIALVMIAASWLLNRDVLAPIARFQRATREVAAGNREFRLGIGGNDEIGELGRSFDVMTSRLDETYGALEAEITERKRAESVLQRTNAQLENAIFVKDGFLANMSHELRTPLNGIIGFAEFLVDQKPGPLNEKQREYLNDVLNSGRHLLQLINDVLDLAKVGSGRTEFHPEPFQVQKTLEEVCSIIEPIAQKKSTRIRARTDPALDTVTLDPQKFKQVLYNLLSNAVKFTNGGGAVEISASPINGSQFRLAVKDDGIGIRADQMQRLFREFEQLESGIDRRYEGAGLGLALTRKLVELQGGNISVESEFGKGSTFSVVLPRVHPGERGAAALRSAGAIQSLQ